MFKVLTKGCEPTKGSKYSSGIDLYASEDCIIAAGGTKIIGLGVCIDMRKFTDSFFPVRENDSDFDKSITESEIIHFIKTHYLELNICDYLSVDGLISNTKIIPLDYKDEIKIIIQNPISGDNLNIAWDGSVIMNNERDQSFKIKKGDKIAQILLKEHKGYLLGVESDEERVCGFGSTGE